MSMDSYESSYREESFRPRMADGNYNPYFFRLRTMTPYSDENIRVDPNRFSKETIQCCEEEEMLEGFIDRIILTCAMKEAGEEDFGDVNTYYDSSFSPVKRQPFGREKVQKQRRSDKRNRRNRRGSFRKEDTGTGEGPITQKSSSSGETITLPTAQFRKMVNAEIEALAHRIHAHYQGQWDSLNDDRIHAYRSCIWWKEQYGRLEYECMKEEHDVAHLHDTCEALQKELDTIKDAKRKRRNAAKIRKNKKDKNDKENEENTPFENPTKTEN